MSFRSTRWFLGMAVGGAMVGAMVGAIALGANSAIAQQVVPDATLPQNSTVTRNGNNFTITDGTPRGGNLFHSFKEFSVPTEGTAIFQNATYIQNIFSRVTGGVRSDIDGLIRANGTANLFLINPNGIVFGKNASLDIRGSFVGTTANAIQFGTQGFFSATNPEAPSPLLTINPSALLFNQIAAAPIQNNSSLSVSDGKSLLLVGGNINMDGGQLNAFGGRVELGGLASAGTVGLNGNGNNLSLSFPNGVERSDVFLSNSARVNVAAGDGGSIAVNAGNLEMTGESILFAGIQSGNGSDNSKAGNISINATGAINLNNKSKIANQVLPEARGQGGDVNISASTLRLEGGAFVSTNTYGVGKGGNLSVDAQNVQLIGTSANGLVASSLGAAAEQNSTGDAGVLTVKTNTLLVKDGAQVNAATFGSGKGGNLSVDAQDVQLIGTSADGQFPSGLSASAQPNSTGDAGSLSIKTNTLLVRDGAQVGTFTSGAGKGGNLSVVAQNVQLIGTTANGQFPSGLSASAEEKLTGDAGNLTIKTNTLVVRNGAQVIAATFGSGKGGNLSVDAQDVQLIGTSADTPSGLSASAQPNSTGDAGSLSIKTNTLLVRDGAQVNTFTSGAGKGGNLSVDAQDVQLIGKSADGQFTSGLGAYAESTGDAGNLTVKTNTLLVRDGATVTVNSLGTGTSGNMTLNARSIRLDSSGTIGATSASANGGSINLEVGDLLLLRRGSQISTSAGTDQKGGNGGNITINTPNGFIVSIPNENSDITANAFNGSGGVIKIKALGIYNFNQRSLSDLENLLGTKDPTKLNPQLLSTNDITAISRTSPALSGQVNIITPDIDPSRGLVTLPTITEVTPKLVSSGCAAASDNSFTITGRGGLPPSPSEPLSSDVVWTDARSPALQQHTSKKPSAKPHSKPKAEPIAIVPATGWVFNFDKGEVTLISSAPNTSGLGTTPSTCPGR